MRWVATHTGKKFDIFNVKPEDICIEDIAHALAHKCRYNGHCATFYSVAEHSIYVSAAVPKQFAMYGLLHDAAEAYLTDIPRPIKGNFYVQLPDGGQTVSFAEFEDHLLAMVMDVVAPGWKGPFPQEVKDMDVRMLATERRNLFLETQPDWELPYEPLPGRIPPPLPPLNAEDLFLLTYWDLRSRWVSELVK